MDEGDEIKKRNGVKRAVVKKTLHHEDYKNCVLKKEDQMRKMNVIRSHKHEVYTETVCKVALYHIRTTSVSSKKMIYIHMHTVITRRYVMKANSCMTISPIHDLVVTLYPQGQLEVPLWQSSSRQLFLS